MRYYDFVLTSFAFVVLMVNGEIREDDLSAVVEDNLVESKRESEESHKDASAPAKRTLEEEEDGITKALIVWKNDNLYKIEGGQAIADKVLKNATEFLAKNCTTPAKKVGMTHLTELSQAAVTGVPPECVDKLVSFLHNHPDVKFAEPDKLLNFES